MQGITNKLSVPAVAVVRRLSNGSLPALTSVCSRSITTYNVSRRRHSVCAESLAPRIPSIESLLPPRAQSLPHEITWLAGAPGAGKGTNSSYISTARGYDAPTIVVSSLLESPECKKIKDAGGMVDDNVVFNLLLKELAKPQYRRGVVVDGFPRTEKQANMISKLHDNMPESTSFNFVTLFIDEQASIERQLSRGDTIRKLNLKRQSSGLEPLEERATDTCEMAARLRYSNFIQQYEAINKLASRFPSAIVDASAPIETVRQRLSSVCTTPSSRPFRRASIFSTLQSSAESQQQQLAYI